MLLLDFSGFANKFIRWDDPGGKGLTGLLFKVERKGQIRDT